MSSEPPMRRRSVPVLLALLAGLHAQEIDALPTEHVLLVAPGSFVDLDTGAALPQAALQKLKADLRLGRDGRGFYMAPLFGGMKAGIGAVKPIGDWSDDRLEWATVRENGPRVLFVRTDRGAVARVVATAVDPYGTGSFLVQWVLAPAGSAAFLPAPRDLVTAWTPGGLALTWSGDAPKYVIEVASGSQITKQTTDVARAVVPGLAPDGVHQVCVRGLFEGGRVTLPATAVQHGKQRPAARGVVEFRRSWYDASGGMSLTQGEVVDQDAEVVFYLYGVYVPGGGVQKVGQGEETFRALAELPEHGYVPVYGRLDDRDVYAVRLADGRYAKLWIDPTEGGDNRDGMRVHFAFLPDGRRHLPAVPGEVAAEMAPAGVRVKWAPAAGAARYRVTSPSLKAPIETAAPELLLADLERDRMHPLEVVAITADGEVSDARAAHVSTYGPGYRVGQFRIEHQRAGIDLATGLAVELRNGKPPAKLDLQFASAAGNYNVLAFLTPYGACAAGALPFGTFPAADARLVFAENYASDDRRPGCERFLVRTHDGGLASVRIRVRDSTVVCDYVLRLPAAK